MSKIITYILDVFKFTEVKAQEEKNNQERKQSGSWPRRLSFTPFPKNCVDDEDEVSSQSDESSFSNSSNKYDFQEDTYLEGECPQSFFTRKISCMFHAGKIGLMEGSLTGVFFGGGWGLYKYLSHQATALLGANKNNDSNKENENDEAEQSGSNTNGSTSNSNETTINENIIFVSACNSALVVGVVCTLVSCTKAAIFC